jgi:WD40 repeat protein
MESLLDFGRSFELRDEHHIPSSISENFIKYLDISPDGSKILCAEESNIAKTWDLNQNVLDGYKFYHNDDVGDNTATLSPTKSSQLCVGESIYDFKWYPFMNAADSSTCCFISTSRDHPIHMWDISTGQIRCSYRCYNNMDELEAANSLCFNIMGDKIYAGSNRMIRCFDVANPGRVCLEQPTCKTRRSPIGQRGIISCLSFNPDCSGAYAAGSYANSVSIYVENSQGAALELSGIEFGATHLKWSPCGNNLWVGGRAHDDIVCWDLRQTRSELGRVKRSLSNNQRLVFDLDPWGCYLATGSQDGE